jgi:hypothetical protein
MMKKYLMGALICGLLIMTLCLSPVLNNAQAVHMPGDYMPIPSINHITAFPSANNQTNTLAIGLGATVLADWYYWPDLYLRYGGLSTTITNDFNKAAYPIGPFYDWNVTASHAPNNATITSVWVVAKFNTALLEYPPPNGAYPSLSYSVNTTPAQFNHTFTPNTVPQERLWVFNRTYANSLQSVAIAAIAANVTSFESWTPKMLKSHTLSARFQINLPPMTVYYLDYLGFYYEWKYNETGGGGGDIGQIGYGSLQMPSPLGLFGIIGFVGMIAAPAAGIWFARRTDGSRLILGLQVMVVFVVFLGLFLASIL